MPLALLYYELSWEPVKHLYALPLTDSDEVMKDPQVDYIDRGIFPSYGSGPVFISHRKGKSRYYKPDEATIYSDFKCLVPKSKSTRPLGTSGIAIDEDYCYCVIDIGATTVVQWAGWAGGNTANTSIEVWHYHGAGKFFRNRFVHNWYKYDDHHGDLKYALRKTYSLAEAAGVFDDRPSNTTCVDYLPYQGRNVVIPEIDDLSPLTAFRYWDGIGAVNDGVINTGFSRAYVNAVENLPQLAMNNIMNTIEAVKAATSLFHVIQGNLGELSLPHNWSSLSRELKDDWLQYRYVWGTTRSDMLELASYLDRIAGARTTNVKTGGSYTENSRQYSVVMSVRSESIVPPDVAKSLSSGYWTRALGLGATPSNVWDMIPFSFMVDWFLHIGDRLKWLETREHGLQLNLSSIWYMLRESHTDSNGSWSIYFRIMGKGAPLAIPFDLTEEPKSGLVWTKRIFDGISIFA